MDGNVETKRLKFCIACGFFLLASQMLTSCAVVRTGMESGSAYLEQPSMELVLDRLNTASSASMMVDVIFNDMAVSDTATWPRRLERFADKDLQPVLRALALDGAYVSHGGFISPIKAHVVQAQHILYELPPDMYSSGGDFYKNGEETIINGYYYKFNSYDDIVKKDDPTAGELTNAIKSATKHIFVKNPTGQIEKRRGKIKSFQITGNQKYDNLMDALFEIAPNGEDLRDSHEEYRETRLKYQWLIDETTQLQKDKTRLTNNEQPVGQYQTISTIDEQLSIRKKELEEYKLRLEETNNILAKEFDNIELYKGEIDDPESARVLLNIVEACNGAEGLLTDSASLTAIAMAKLPSSVSNLSDEFKGLNPAGGTNASSPTGIFGVLSQSNTKIASNAWLPLRMARLRFNIGNIGDSISAIGHLLSTDLSLVMTIHQKANMLLNPKVAQEIKEEMQAEPLTEEPLQIAATQEEEAPPMPQAAIPIVHQDPQTEIQTLLTRLGYNPGPIDGKPGKKTRNAIKEFQKDFNYPQTGVPNTMFLTIIRCASELEFEEGADIKNNPGRIKSFIKEVQSSLKQLGYQPGGVDGQPGKKTLTAIKNFQADSGYLENGRLNRETLNQLQEELKENGIKIL